MSSQGTHILLVGCGKMGQAMLESWVKDPSITHITIIDPATMPASITEYEHVTGLNNAEDLITTPDIAILAVKPQIMDSVCESLKPKLDAQTLILSIAAGKSIASFEALFGKAQPIIRTMPNTPAAIGKGITALCPNKHTSEAQIKTATALLTVTGQVERVEDESLFNAITALSGSGPAYIFHMIELLETAGTEIGLPPELALKLARQTVIGSAALAGTMADTPASILRENVTSPGGTTAAALEILRNGEAQELYNKALNAAKTRGEELDS